MRDHAASFHAMTEILRRFAAAMTSGLELVSIFMRHPNFH